VTPISESGMGIRSATVTSSACYLTRWLVALGLVAVVAFLPRSWCVAGRWFLEPGGRSGPGRESFGALAGRAVMGRRLRNPRRTRAGVSRPGRAAGFSQERRSGTLLFHPGAEHYQGHSGGGHCRQGGGLPASPPGTRSCRTLAADTTNSGRGPATLRVVAAFTELTVAI
jgi:hypothetical protein